MGLYLAVIIESPSIERRPIVMIIYFSATGNSKYVAKRIAEAENDWTRSVTTFDYGYPVEVRKKNVFGIVCPTYFGGLPINIEDFLRTWKLKVEPGTYVFYVTTYGGDSGHPEVPMKEILAERGIELSASFSVKMPENYTPMFDVNDKAAIDRILEEAEPQIDEIIAHVKNRDVGNFIKSDSKMNYEEARRMYDEHRRTSNFTVSDDCIGCMLCAKRCPSRAIEMVNGRPHWKKELCTLCLGCLHRCPQSAIQYGDKTKGRGQYKNPHDQTWEA